MINKKVNRPKPPIRRPRMYLERKRVCCKCGNNRTSDKIINAVQWHSDLNEHGKWTGKWKCHKCYSKEYQEKRIQDARIMREDFIMRRIESNDKLNDDNDIKQEKR